MEIPDLGQVFSVGPLFRQESPTEWRGETETSAVEQLVIGSIAWDEDLEWLVIDTPPTSGDEVSKTPPKLIPSIRRTSVKGTDGIWRHSTPSKLLSLPAVEECSIIGPDSR